MVQIYLGCKGTAVLFLMCNIKKEGADAFTEKYFVSIFLIVSKIFICFVFSRLQVWWQTVEVRLIIFSRVHGMIK